MGRTRLLDQLIESTLLNNSVPSMSYPTCQVPLASSNTGSYSLSLTDLPHMLTYTIEPSEFSKLSELSELTELPTELFDSNERDNGGNLERPSKPQYKPHRTTDQKLDLIFEAFRQNNWSLGEFITSLCTSSNPKNICQHLTFAKVAYSDKSVLDRFLTPDIRVQLLNSLDWGRPELISELNHVGKNSLYGSYDSERFEAFGSDSANLKPFEKLLQESAPVLLQTLKSLSEPNETGRKTDYMAHWVLIVSILNFSRHRILGSNLPTLLGIHLFAKGLKARELDLLGRLGVTVSYKTVHRMLEQLGKQGANDLAQAGQSESAVMAYDNFEQVESIKSQRLDENSTFHSVTTGELVAGAHIPAGGLMQDMLGNAPLTLDQALRNPGNRVDDTELQVSYANIYFLMYI